jgi:hypothetical protein
MRLEMAGEMPNAAAMRADGYSGSTLSIVKLAHRPVSAWRGRIHPRFDRNGRSSTAVTHLLRIANLAISAANTNRSWGFVIMLFLRVHICLPATRTRRVFLPPALADGEPSSR